MDHALHGATLTRSEFLGSAASCGAHVALLATLSPTLMRHAFARPQDARIAAQEPWGRLEKVADGVWALISTPLQDRTTLCNGGIVQGRGGVAIIEALRSRAARTDWRSVRASSPAGTPTWSWSHTITAITAAGSPDS